MCAAKSFSPTSSEGLVLWAQDNSCPEGQTPASQETAVPVSCVLSWCLEPCNPVSLPAQPPSPRRFARSYHYLQLLKALKKEVKGTLHRQCVDG